MFMGMQELTFSASPFLCKKHIQDLTKSAFYDKFIIYIIIEAKLL